VIYFFSSARQDPHEAHEEGRGSVRELLSVAFDRLLLCFDNKTKLAGLKRRPRLVLLPVPAFFVVDIA
jgi:hypothetical protein